MTDVAAAPRRRSRADRAGWALFLLLVDGPLVGAVLAGLLAAYVSWDPLWWTQLAAIGLPYLAWPLAALGVACVAWRRWRAAAVHAVLLAVLVVRAGAPGRFSAPEPAPDDLQLVTFNVPRSGPSGEVLADSLERFVEAAAPDLLLLQDASVVVEARPAPLTESLQVETVRERLGFALALPAPPADGSVRVEVPVLTAPGAGVERLGAEVVSTGDVDGSHALRTHLRWAGREFVVYNLHLRSFGADKPWDDPAISPVRPRTWAPYLRRYRGVYAARGAEAAALAERIAEETLPVVVAGDFNSTADNRSYHVLRTAGGVDRADAMQAVGGGRWGRTYHAERPFVRIDAVLVDPALEVVSAATAPVGFSDHRPVAVALRWRDGGGS